MEQLNNTTSERVDDLTIIIHWLSQMQIQLSIDLIENYQHHMEIVRV